MKDPGDVELIPDIFVMSLGLGICMLKLRGEDFVKILLTL